MISKNSVDKVSRRLEDVFSEMDEAWKSVSSLRLKVATLRSKEHKLVTSIRSLRREIRAYKREWTKFSKLLEGVTHEPYRKDLLEIIQINKVEKEIAANRLAWRERRLESMRVKMESTSAEVNALDDRLDELTDSRNLIIRSLTACVSEEAVLNCG